MTDEEKKKQIDEMACKIFEYICTVEPDEEKRIQLFREEAASFVSASIDVFSDDVFHQLSETLEEVKQLCAGGILRIRLLNDQSRIMKKNMSNGTTQNDKKPRGK